MHHVLDIKSTQIIQSCNIPLKLNQIIQNPTHANTPTKTRTNTRPTDTHLQLCLYIHTNTPNLHPQKRPQIHLQLNYSVHVTMLHSNMLSTPTNTPTNTTLRQYRCFHKRKPPSHYVEIPAVQSQQQSPSVENANKKKVHMYAYTS